MVLNARAWEENTPLLRTSPSFPESIPIHFYDVETFGEKCYLHGGIRVFGEERSEYQFLARTPDDEGHAWHEFLDFLAGDKNAVIYCWSPYERGVVDRLRSLYGGNDAGWALLDGNLVDQCQFVKSHFALPTTSYSIKKVAPLFGFAWDADDAGGMNSELWYQSWLETEDEHILKKILRYNLDDVVAMEVIHNALKSKFG